MGHHHQGDALLVEFIKQFQHLGGGAGVQSPCGFVCQQQTRAVDDGPGDGHPLLLPSGELIGLVLQTLRQTNAAQGRLGSLDPFSLGTPA